MPGPVSLTASVARRAPSAAKETGPGQLAVNDVMALLGVNNVMALEN